MPKHFPGDMLWRVCDNRLFIVSEIIHDEIYVMIDPLNLDSKPEIQYVNVPAIDDNGEDAPYVMNAKHLPYVNQVVWRIGTDQEFRVTKIHDTWTKSFDPKGPCNSCSRGVCEQCHWGYRSNDDVMEEYKEMYNPKNRYDIVVLSVDGKDTRRRSIDMFYNDFTSIPPNISELTKKVLSYKYTGADEIQHSNIIRMVEEDMIRRGDVGVIGGFERYAEAQNIDNVEKESCQKWKDSLHVVNTPAFDLEFFKACDAYVIEECSCPGFKYNAILTNAEFDKLGFIKVTEKAYTSPTSEYKEISIKDYTEGKYTIKKLVVEENKNA